MHSESLARAASFLRRAGRIRRSSRPSDPDACCHSQGSSMELASKFIGLDFEPIVMIHELVSRDLSPPAYVDALRRHAQASRAVTHSLLKRIADGAFRDPRA